MINIACLWENGNMSNTCYWQNVNYITACAVKIMPLPCGRKLTVVFASEIS